MKPSTDFDPDAYIASLFERHAELGADYVRRQVEWAEGILQERLMEKSSSMAGASAPGEARFTASPSAASPAIVARERNLHV